MSSSAPPSWAEHPELVAFYKEHRNCPEDLYLSEKRFLPWLASHATSVLDVGCGAGGFRHIWRYYHPGVIYIGVDVSFALVAAARQLYPDTEFHQGDCATGLSLPDRRADVVQALGWLHWERRYPEAIKELWRLTRRYLFFDVRLVDGVEQPVIGSQRLAFVKPWDGETTTPYICVAWPSFAALLVELKPAIFLGYGYWGKPAETVVGVDQQVCFATFVLEKASVKIETRRSKVCLNLPLEWPPGLAERVELLPAAQLDAMVPPADVASECAKGGIE